MNALKTLSDDCLDAQQTRPFCGPIARRSGTILLAGDDDEWHSVGLIALRCCENRHLLAVRQMASDPAFGTGRKFVAQTNIGKRTTYHDLMIAASCAVRVKICGDDAVLDQVLASRTALRDIARRRNVIGRDGIAEHSEDARARSEE